MSRSAVSATALAKHYRIPSPSAPALSAYLRRPLWALRQPGAMRIDALAGVSFEVREGEVFGIIGRNGAGKSTLLKILSRITSPSAGRASIRGRVASLLEVGTGFHPELTGRENVYLNGMLLGMSRQEVDAAIDAICDFAGVGPYLNVPIKRYSSGMQLRLAFAVAANLAADTMIIDEVLAVGDAEFQAKCTTAMSDAAGRGRTTLFVSHNLVAVQNLCSRVMWLERGQVRAIGPAAEVVRQYLHGVGAGAGELRPYEAPPSRSGGTPVRIRRARVRGASGGAPVQGEDLIVEVELEAFDRVAGVQLAVGLATTDGAQLCWLCNGDYRGEWEMKEGPYRAEIRISSVRLLPRSYSVSLHTFRNWGAESFEHIANALTFPVLESDVLGTGVSLKSDRGVTWMPAEFHLASTPAAAEVGLPLEPIS